MRTAHELCQDMEWKTLPIVFNMYYGRTEERQPIVVADGTAISKLLAMKWKAVPTLIDELGNDAVPVRKRSWLFAMLWGITEDNAPVAGLFWSDYCNVLGDYHVLDQFVRVGIKEDIRSGKDVQFKPGSNRGRRPVSEDNQRKMANAWFAWKDCIVVQVQD